MLDEIVGGATIDKNLYLVSVDEAINPKGMRMEQPIEGM